MSYTLYSENGYVQDIASVNGYYEMLKFCMENGGDYLKTFVEKGESDYPDKVRQDIFNVLPKCSDPGVKKTLEELIEGLEGIKEIAIISE